MLGEKLLSPERDTLQEGVLKIAHDYQTKGLELYLCFNVGFVSKWADRELAGDTCAFIAQGDEDVRVSRPLFRQLRKSLVVRPLCGDARSAH